MNRPPRLLPIIELRDIPEPGDLEADLSPDSRWYHDDTVGEAGAWCYRRGDEESDGDYYVALEDVNTVGDVQDWLRHLRLKRWITHTDLAELALVLVGHLAELGRVGMRPRRQRGARR